MHPAPIRPRQIITSVAPIRVGDVGGWTDTWFAEYGRVCNIAVYPYVEVQILVGQRQEDRPRIAVHAENFGLRYTIDQLDRAYDKIPLLEAALRRLPVGADQQLDIVIHSQIPPGASTGTSAAVSVAIIAALDRLTPGRLTPYEVARLAHAIEVEDLGLQSGIQDQLCSAYGGVNLIEMAAFPHAAVSPIALSQAQWWELERRLALVYVGRPHQSSAIHRQVIDHLGDHPANDPRLQRLRDLALSAKDALSAGAWDALGRVWAANTQIQRELHPELVSAQSEQIMAIAGDFGVVGCKVNGAGGDGGSLTVLCDERSDRKRALLQALEEAGFATMPLYLARQGLRVWETAGQDGG